jgi:hypothetical protein
MAALVAGDCPCHINRNGEYEVERLIENTQAKIEQLVENMDAKTRQFTGAPCWMKVGGERDRVADSAYDMPVEYKRKLLLQIHLIIERWCHFMAEITAKCRRRRSLLRSNSVRRFRSRPSAQSRALVCNCFRS